MMTAQIPAGRNGALSVAAALVGVALVLGACTHTDRALIASVPED